LLLAATSLAPFVACAAESYVVKFKLADTGHPLVEADIGGQKDWMVFDTGAYISTYITGGARTVNLGGAKATVQFGGDNSGQLAALRRMSPDMAQVGGLIGYDFYARYVVTMDYQKKEITLTPHNIAPSARTAAARISRTTPARCVALGFTAQDADNKSHGARVQSVSAGSQAEKAGLRIGDVIVGFGAWWIDDAQDLSMALAATEPNENIRIHVVRDGKVMELKLTVRAGF
jgi:membrane-associated protease RseP (regulator of RpoE activity)